MRSSAKLGLTALTAAMLLATAVGAASARNLSVSSQNLRATWSRFELISSLVTIRCPLTIEGSLHSRTIAKIRGDLIGAVTRVSIKEESCTNGRLQATSLPWHITYESFTGSLPTSISAIQLLLARFRFSFELLGRCEYGTATDNIVLSSRLRLLETTSIAPVVGANTINRAEGACSETATLVGPEGIVTQLNSSARIRVTLI